jgi:uncharacterized protein (TIGR00251 family)
VAGEETTGDVLLRLRVKPHAKRAGLVGWHGDALKIAVRSAAERGRANDEVLALIARTLGVAAGQVSLESGARSQDKRVRVRSVDAAAARQRIDAALAAAAARRGQDE